MADLSNKVVVIMGASSGIGAATARRLAKDGAKLVIAARRGDRLKEIASEFADGQVIPVQADVTNFKEVKAAMATAVNKFGRIDVLYNNAGIMPLSNLSEGHRDEWQNMVNINIMGPLNGIAAALPIMKKQGQGHIITTDSVAGHVVAPGMAVYSGTKYATRIIMDGLRMEEAPNHIKTTIITPGATQSELTSHISDPTTRKANTDYWDQVDGLSADQIAQAVEFVIAAKDNMSVSEMIVRPTLQTM
ncbi:SDR family oxidoreductase [uncultured Limosilactobacillus sp.]|uniref:SDR family oxidoreductase n=1 Tax=uncultured Limosilactobacillus sp. TaxID=2837629 RepID=UPI0025DFB0BE|nr:SDR family oxidoreductase [uncultured Limosilactobacillus sp.]